MGQRQSSSARRRSGCVPSVMWAGIVVNIGLILWSFGSGNGFSLETLRALLTPSATSVGAAQRALLRGDFETALTASQTALTRDPTESAAHVTLVRSLIYRSYVDFEYETDRADALELARLRTERADADHDVWAVYAFALQANGNPVEAVEVAERVLQVDPEHVLARSALALGYAGVGSFDRAHQESETARAHRPDDPAQFEALRAFAISTADLGNYAQAGELLDGLLEAQPRFIPLHFERALYAKQVGDAGRATEAYYQVMALAPSNVKAHMRLCELSSELNERAASQRYCAWVTEHAPDLPEGWYRLGREYYLSSDFALAQQTLNKCSSLQVTQGVPPNERIFECWYLQGQAAEILGDCRALLTIYTQFRIMASDPSVQARWVYPPEGPPMCNTSDGAG